MAAAFAVLSVGGPDAAIAALRSSVSFLLRDTPYTVAPWLTSDLLATPVRTLAGLFALTVLLWAFWPPRQRAAGPPNHEMKSLRDLFDEDCGKTFALGGDVNVEIDGVAITVRQSVAQEMAGNAKWPSYFVPRSPIAFQTALALASEYMRIMDELLAGVEITSSYPGDGTHVSNTNLVFSGRVYIYHEDFLEIQQVAALDAAYTRHGARLMLRGPSYASTRNMGDRTATSANPLTAAT